MKINNTFAIGCIVQWYEIEIINLYIESVKQSIEHIENKDNIIIDFTFVINQDLEKIKEMFLIIYGKTAQVVEV